MADIIRYVDPLRPDDDGDGLSMETAKKYYTSLGSVINRSTDNKVIRFRGGLHHEVKPGTSWSGSISGWNVTFEPYWLPGDEPTNPVLDGVTWVGEDSGGWTLEGTATGPAGGFVWSKIFGTSQTVRRVWSASKNNGPRRSQRTLGPALRRTPDQTKSGMTATQNNITSIRAALSPTDSWFCADATLGYRLYMWSPSDTIDPAKHHKGLGLAQGGTGTLGFGFGIGPTNSRNMRIDRVDVLAPTASGLAIAVTDTDPICQNISFYRCNILGVFSGIRVTQVATAAYLTAIDNIEFRECHIDPLTSAGEQEPNEGYSLISGTDQADIRGKVRGVRLIDCSGRNPGHAGMNIGSWDSAGAKPSQSGFLRHRVVCDEWVTYSRSIGMSLCEPSCYIIGCTIMGTNVVGQLAGSGMVVANRFIGLRKCVRKVSDAFNSYDGWINIFVYRGTGNAAMGNERWWDMKPDNLIFAHNSCDGVYGTPIDMFYFKSTDTTSLAAKPQTAVPDNSFLVYNNLYIEKNVPERAGKPIVVSAVEVGAPSLGVQPFYNNALYSSFQVPTVRINGTTYSDINAAPGFQKTITADPKVDANLRPLPGSPLIKAGRFAGVKTDYMGKRFGRRPTIGAFEVDAPLVRKPRFGVAA